ncbi:MAG: MotA/TolQ/ExbB proton channel family protein [Verrucomicrobiota bacterium]
MIPLGLTALILYGKAAEIRMQLGEKNFKSSKWQFGSRSSGGAEEMAVARGYLKSRGIEMREGATGDEVSAVFAEVRAEELPPVDRNLKFMKVAMSAAPLWGLLGTVTGMLITFDSLARGGGSDDTMNNVAGGISEALITTQTGLMVALPGYFFYYFLSRQREAFSNFLFGMETACAQKIITESAKDVTVEMPVSEGHEEREVGVEAGEMVVAPA